MKNYEDIKKEWLKDPEFKREYDKLEPQYQIIRAIIEARIKSGISQQELAERAHTKQSAISRLENGNAAPSMPFLQKIATALNQEIRITVRP